MKGQRIIFGSALLMLAGCQTIGGESMPTLTRTPISGRGPPGSREGRTAAVGTRLTF